MNSEIKTCQNCKQNFVIESDDFNFYERVHVPPPTFCPECRFLQRVVWRNEWILRKRKDSLTGKNIFSVYSDSAPIKVYHRDYWWSDAWDATSYGMDYDWSRPFFAQVKELIDEVPFPSGAVVGGENSDYCMNFSYLKNCYLMFASGYCEDSAYVVWATDSKNCFDGHMIHQSELCYENLNITKCYKTFFSVNCEECQDVYFSKDCIGCVNCFGCVNLRNKSFHIFNKPYAKEEYFAKLNVFKISSFHNLERIKSEARAFWLCYPNKFMTGRKNVDVGGEYIRNSKNAQNCYRVRDAEHIKYCQNIIKSTTKDCYDYTNWGENSELVYHSLQCGDNAYNVKFCVSSFPAARENQYSLFCASSQNLFGCVGLKKKKYCILNKEYSKEEYEKLVPKVIQHMNDMPYTDKKGIVYKYGDFFPMEFSPLAYNETLAHEFFPSTKEKVLAEGLRWQDAEKRNYEITKEPADLPDDIKEVPDSIISETISCAHEGKCNDNCPTAFRITQSELNFYRRMNIPLPRLCFHCRHNQRIKQRNPLTFKLWKRQCMCQGATSDPDPLRYGAGKRHEISDNETTYANAAKHFHGNQLCPNEFETSYAPERPEIVYCETCYNAEVV